MILLLVIAPLAKLAYTVFPEEGFGEYFFHSPYLIIHNFLEPDGWYYGHFYYFAWSCSEIWTPLIMLYGLYLLFPKTYPVKYLISVPIGYYLAMLIQRVTVQDLQDFHSTVSLPAVVACIVLSVVLLIVSDRLLYRRNHVVRGAVARILGLIRLPDGSVPDRKRIRMLQKEAEELGRENEVW